MNLWHALVEGKDAHKLAIEAPDAHLSYGELIEASQVAADDLIDRGLAAGDRVAYLGLNSATLLVLVFACARTGLIFAPLNWRLAGDELAWIVADADPSLIIADAAHSGVANQIASGRAVAEAHAFLRHRASTRRSSAQASSSWASKADLLLVYTSGTTGRPKGAVLTQDAVLANAVLSHHMHHMSAEDRVLTCLPMFHVGGLNIQTLPALIAGATVSLMDRFDPQGCLDLIGRFKPTLTVQVPATMQALMNSTGWRTTDLSSLRAIATGSTDVPIPMIQAVHARGIPVIQIYGATETGPVVIYQQPETAMATEGSIGRAGPGVDVRIVANGVDLAVDQPGEIWVRSQTLARGYWLGRGDDAFQDGWFRTGDIARRDQNGDLWFADRLKNVIISGGENIYPAELERILNAIPGVREAAVVARKDPRWGEVPIAAVSGDIGRSAVLDAFEGRIARFKHPKDVVYLDALPRNAMGKVDLAALRDVIESK